MGGPHSPTLWASPSGRRRSAIGRRRTLKRPAGSPTIPIISAISQFSEQLHMAQRLPLLLLAALCLLAVEAKFTQKLVGRESLRSRLVREGRWAEYKMLNQAAFNRMSILAGQAAPSSPVLDYGDAEYVIEIGIGSGNQTFTVVPDTGSSNLWVADQSCNDQGCDNKQKFDSANSETYVKTDGQFKISYGTGSAKGILGNDTVLLAGGELQVKGTVFGQATELAAFFQNQSMDGILGLAWPSIAVSKVQPVFQRAIALKAVEQPVFTFYLEAKGGNSNGSVGGQLTFGGTDDENCAKVQHWVRLSATTYWQYRVSGTGVNGKQTKQNLNAISDSGTSMLAVPSQILRQVARAAGARYSPQIGLYVLENGNKQFSWSVWIGGQEFRLPASALTIEFGQGVKALAMQAMPQQRGMPNMILGDPFFRAFCHTFDVANKRIGLSRPIAKK